MWWLTIGADSWIFPGLKECVESDTFQKRPRGCAYKIEHREEFSSHGTEWCCG